LFLVQSPYETDEQNDGQTIGRQKLYRIDNFYFTKHR